MNNRLEDEHNAEAAFAQNHSLQFLTPVINRLVDGLLVNILPAGARKISARLGGTVFIGPPCIL